MVLGGHRTAFTAKMNWKQRKNLVIKAQQIARKNEKFTRGDAMRFKKMISAFEDTGKDTSVADKVTWVEQDKNADAPKFKPNQQIQDLPDTQPFSVQAGGDISDNATSPAVMRTNANIKAVLQSDLTPEEDMRADQPQSNLRIFPVTQEMVSRLTDGFKFNPKEFIKKLSKKEREKANNIGLKPKSSEEVTSYLKYVERLAELEEAA